MRVGAGDKPEGDQKDLRCQNVSKHSVLLAREWGHPTVGSLQRTMKSFLLKCTCGKPGPPESPVSPPRVWDGGGSPDASTCLLQVKGAAQRPEMVLATRRATVPFQADGDAWGEQKEQRAALTVGILIGVFALCWIPFFTAELLSPLRTCDSPATWKSVFLWLGYSNSFLNPPSTWPSTRTTTAPSRTSSRGTAESEAGQARGTRPSAHPHPATTCQRQGFEVPRVAPRANWLTAALPAGSESAWAVPGTSFYPIYLLVLTRHCTATDLAHQVPFPL